MGAILYIARRQIVNSARRFFHKPARVAAGAASAALVLWTLFDFPKTSGGALDPRILHGLFLAWLLVLGTVALLSSLKSGASLFSMPDVNFLFVSPVGPKKILAWGLARQTGKNLAGFLFLLLYGGMLADGFGVSARGVWLLALGTAACLSALQTAAFGLYCFIGGNPSRRRAVRAGIFAIPALILAIVLLLARRGGGTPEALAAAVSSPALEWIPVFGWTKGAAFALLTGDGRSALVYGALLAAFFVLAAALLFRSDADCFEDALLGAETAFAPRRSARKKHGKTGGTGIGRGWGANAFFYRQLREARRGGRFPFSGLGSAGLLALLNFGVAVALTLIGRTRGTPVPADALLAAGCGVGVYALFFLSASGGWSDELAKPYLYLVPESPFQKLLWAAMPAVLRPAADGLAVFALFGAFLRANPFTALACALVYAGFGFVFTAGGILGRRVLGGPPNRGVTVMLSLAILFAAVAPGAAGSLFAAAAFGPGRVGSGPAPLLVALPCVVWNLFLSLSAFCACRNLLASAEP